MRLRPPAAAALAALIGLAPVFALPAFAGSVAPSAQAATVDAIAASPKVVIVVGATESTTPAYRADADKIYAEAIKYTPNVIKIYSPNATWAKVKAAAQGASIFVYLGHGYGFPSPYRSVLTPTIHNGMGLNEIGGVSDSDKKYYGESLIASDIRFAKNAVVLLNHLCYSAGSSESGHAEPTQAVARERVDNYASGFIKAGARAVLAQSWTSGVIYTIRSIFTTNQSFSTMWRNAPNEQGHEIPFVPTRNPQFEGRVDPDTWTSGYHRSIVGAMDMLTSDVVAGAGVAPTNPTPDAASPQLWSVDGTRQVSPNFDGLNDTLGLLARFSENVTWTSALENAEGTVVRAQSGTGHQAALDWNAQIDGVVAPEGTYTWRLHATDAAGNPALDESGPFTVAHHPTPETGVLSFKPTTPTPTISSTVTYALKFAGPVSGLAAPDFTRSGTATSCVLAAPSGAGADYTLTLTGCSTGSVVLTLNSATVADGAANVGPAGPIIAATVTIDKTRPTTTAPRGELRSGLQLDSASTSQGLRMRLVWSGTDVGAGIASYDVARSYDGATPQIIVSATTATTLNWLVTPGHTYRFQVRARDKAGNVGAWAIASTWYPVLTQQSSTSLVYTGAWVSGPHASHSGGTVKSAMPAGASVSYAFSGRSIAWVTTLAPTTGAVQVYVDGVLAATVDTLAPSTTYRHVAYSKSWPSYGAHTIKLVVVGTAGRPKAHVDAFEVIR